MKFLINPFTGQFDLVGTTSGGGGSGNVTGIPPTDINAIVRWATTDGSVIENSPFTYVQDSGAIQAQGFVFDRQILNDITVPDQRGEDAGGAPGGDPATPRKSRDGTLPPCPGHVPA